MSKTSATGPTVPTDMADMADMAEVADMADMADMADIADIADRADMADRANSRVILPTIAYIDGKSEIMTPLTGPLTDSPNYKEMLSHLKNTRLGVCYPLVGLFCT